MTFIARRERLARPAFVTDSEKIAGKFCSLHLPSEEQEQEQEQRRRRRKKRKKEKKEKKERKKRGKKKKEKEAKEKKRKGLILEIFRSLWVVCCALLCVQARVSSTV